MEENIEEAIRSAYERACTIHLTKNPNIILNWAAFEESQKNIEKARGILKDLNNQLPGMMMVTLRRAGLERRNGQPEIGIKILTEEIDKSNSVDEKSFLAIKCSRYFTRVYFYSSISLSILVVLV